MRTLIALITMSLLMACCTSPPQAEKPAPKRVGPHRIVRPPASLNVQKPLVIAVIDTGMGWQGKGQDAHLCQFGHKDFTTKQEFSPFFHLHDKVPQDLHSHGTHIIGLINEYASKGKRPFCIVVLKYYDDTLKEDFMDHEIEAIKYATNIHADIINFSGGGTEFSSSENVAVKKFLDQGGTFIAAAGNEHADLSKKTYYPAMTDSRVISVGNIDTKGMIVKSSNFGEKISCYEVGENVKMYDMYMTGTSQSTAIATGKFVANKPCGTK